MGVALIALFVALGGTGYAAITITGKNVKNGSLAGRDIKRNSLGGREIRESRVGKVPKAKVADRLATKSAAAVTTRGFFTAQKTPKAFTGTETFIGALRDLPGGDYVLSAKVSVSNTATATLRVTCALKAGGETDQGTVALQPGSQFGNTAVIPMLLSHYSAGNYDASLTCRSEGPTGLNLFGNPPFTTATNAKVAGIRVDAARSTDF